jgi:hypothetical protein
VYTMGSADRFVVGAGSLRYESANGAAWEFIAEQILCVGEATTESGADGEDWKLCLVTNAHGEWAEGSLQADGRNDALQWLSVKLGCSLEVKLANAPAFRSRVMWPAALLERPLFEYQVAPLRRIFSRTLRRIGFATVQPVQSIHPAVLDHHSLRTGKISAWRAHRGPG